MAELFAPSLVDQIAAVRREIAMREHVYPRRIAAKRMTQAAADRELAAMRAVLVTLSEGLNVEREACARIAETAWRDLSCPDDDSAEAARLACAKAGAAIRARGGSQQ